MRRLISWLALLMFCLSAHASPRENVLSLVAGEWVAQALYAVTKLDVADKLLDGPQTIDVLAKQTACHQENLYRLLRMLASVGVFHEGENRRFSNTANSELLTKDHPESLRSLILFYGAEMSDSWRRVLDCAREGKPAFELEFGEPVFAYFREHPASAALFNAAMREKSKAVISACLHAYDFSRFTAVYDIGGGLGHFLTALLQSNPQQRGVLYDLPQVITVAQMPFRERCELSSGDFFESIPKSGDAYLLKSVLHDWSDQDALRILQRCHEAMGAHAKLVIVETIIASANKRDYAKCIDAHMMVITGGKERTLADFQSLLASAGFSIVSVTPTDTEFSIIEACKK